MCLSLSADILRVLMAPDSAQLTASACQCCVLRAAWRVRGSLHNATHDTMVRVRPDGRPTVHAAVKKAVESLDAICFSVPRCCAYAGPRSQPSCGASPQLELLNLMTFRILSITCSSFITGGPVLPRRPSLYLAIFGPLAYTAVSWHCARSRERATAPYKRLVADLHS